MEMTIITELSSFRETECPLLFFLVFLPFLGPLPRHMEVPRRGVELELQLPA